MNTVLVFAAKLDNPLVQWESYGMCGGALGAASRAGLCLRLWAFGSSLGPLALRLGNKNGICPLDV